ncbi:asparagine synthase (glutamine-hydrolyzing) [Longispora albida]|uniref:asparagine synthase (glutamine-hydrolyzing) n=1 Tax=Longispora albida TaxID=203523 RepID=UPI000377B7E1|nr:asparagine synthase (glutamine-hydrolyzing) [Longispora albida]
MCGLLTFVSAHGTAGLHREAFEAALDTIQHRGPDEGEVHTAGDDVLLGFRRLSIIDVENSHQPIWYAGKRYVLTFNGEIYNYIELREELARQFGAEFATEGDAEAIVAAYHYWGPQAVKKLRGMFAFLIWDTQSKTAFGARDPFGIKPLFYTVTEDGLYTASEKKALMPFSAAARTGDSGIDAASLSHYLTLQYVPEPATLTRGISRLGSGECFTYQPGGSMEIMRYWKPEFRPTAVSDPERKYAEIREALRESVRMHMRSDVPVGAFLSSGIDSTAIVALAREFNPNILTFTAAMDVEGYSELDVAQDSARHLGVKTFPVVVTAQMMMDALPKIVWHLDDPVADPALVPLYYVSKLAGEHVTVALSGEGADEFFGGYTIYREPLSLRSVSGLPGGVQKGLRAVSKVIPEGVKGKSFLERGTTPITERYYGNARMFNEDEKREVMRRYDPGVRYTDVTDGIYAEAANLDDVTKMQYVDLYTWLRGDILVKADRMSMANSLEVRVPFLDYEVFNVAADLPVDLKLPPKSAETKYALRQALRGVVPPEIVNRKKLGFPTPIRVWLRNEMYEWTKHVFATSGADGLVDLAYAQRMLDAHRAGEGDYSRKVWTMLIFCLWYAIYVDRTLDPGIQHNASQLALKPRVERVVA